MDDSPNIIVLTEHVEGDEYKLLVLKLEGQSIGTCQVAGWNEDQPSILGLIVDPQHRRRGFASALIQKAIELATGDGKTALTLTVEKENLPAIDLYRRLGFATDLEDSIQLWMSIALKR